MVWRDESDVRSPPMSFVSGAMPTNTSHPHHTSRAVVWASLIYHIINRAYR